MEGVAYVVKSGASWPKKYLSWPKKNIFPHAGFHMLAYLCLLGAAI